MATMPTDPRIWLMLQLADSAFPTGGFGHSGGLESAFHQGEVRGSADLEGYLDAALVQAGVCSVPFVTAVHQDPSQLDAVDVRCDAWLSSTVANRASRLQGQATRAAVERCFGLPIPAPPCCHFAPVFGATAVALDLDPAWAVRLFLFVHLRGLVSAAVRLGVLGPIEGQRVQRQLSTRAEQVAEASVIRGLDDLAQTAPLLDLWQGAQDRLYSRLFQS